ncbi:MAG: rhomboid family intramembrane serine protease [Ferruginibacter sp.]
MPKQQQDVSINGVDKERILAIAVAAFKQLNWELLFAGEEKLMASTPKSWKTKGQQVVITASDNSFNINSEMIHGESFDIAGYNKKNINNFILAFNQCSDSVTESDIEQNKLLLSDLINKTKIQVAADEKEAIEIDEAMNISKGSLYITYGIISINILVFILMAINGAGIIDVNSLVHIKWGSNFTALTLTGDWWRLVTNIFIHFGIIHVLMNMYCLYTIGIYLEPMLGKVKYITAYLCTGILASVTSLWWHSEGVNSAGASGAVFGMYGLFLALLASNLIPVKVRKALLQSIGIFVVYNLAYGMKSGIDNAAHIGGLLSGFAIGFLYMLSLKKEKEGESLTWVMPLVILGSISVAVFYLSNQKANPDERNAILKEIAATDFADNEKYNTEFNNFADAEEQALTMFNEKLSDAEVLNKIETVSLPAWEKAESSLRQMKTFNVSKNKHLRTAKLLEYVQLRKKEARMIKRMINTGEVENLIPQLEKIRVDMNRNMEEIQKL